jgi:2-polyprenyl-6-methoxyphenol hydroxylase-like FAD-dependent oxidoreductase
VTDIPVTGPALADASPAPGGRSDDRALRCVVAGGSLVGLSAAIALSRLGFEVTVAERSPARAVDGGGGLGVDVALLREVTGIDADPPVLRGTDRDGTAWHLLHEAGLLDGQTVHGSLAPGALPAPARQRLAAFAAARWPSPWREALALALEAGTVFGTPIVHYRPARLVAGRVALAGDAAHAASPMVGGGFRQGLYDVRALTQALTGANSPDEVPDALARYCQARLAAAIRHVTGSEQETAAYLARAARRPAATH